MAQIFLVLIILVPFLSFILKKLKTSKVTPPFPPGPTPWPLLGNIPQMATKMPHIALSDLSKTHGPLIMIRLGSQKIVVASSPTSAKEILTTHDQLLSSRYVPKCVTYNQEILNKCSHAWAETSSDGWKFGRTLSRAELFSMKSLDAQSFIREKKISQMIEHIKTRNQRDTINIQELAFTTTYNMLSNVLLSSDLIEFDENDEDGGVKGLIREMFELTVSPNISDFYPILTRFDLQGISKKSRKIIMRFNAIFEPIIQQRRMAMEKKSKGPISQNDYLDILLLNNFTDFQIQNIIMELISAGADTSTSAVEWAMAELIKSPTSMTKVIEELDREIGTHLGTHIVNESHLLKLPYLQACIKETLRLHPPSPILLPRQAPETCQVMKYTIPKDAQVYINIWAMGRDPLVWDEPLMFKPERFLLNSTLDFIENDFEFIPFGGGRRICPGLPIAKRQVSLVLATLLHSFDWSLPYGMIPRELDMAEKFGVSLLKEQPLLLIPKLRK